MDPIRNPYAPGAGQRPPELAGRDEQLDALWAGLQARWRFEVDISAVLNSLDLLR